MEWKRVQTNDRSKWFVFHIFCCFLLSLHRLAFRRSEGVVYWARVNNFLFPFFAIPLKSALLFGSAPSHRFVFNSLSSLIGVRWCINSNKRVHWSAGFSFVTKRSDTRMAINVLLFSMNIMIWSHRRRNIEHSEIEKIFRSLLLLVCCCCCFVYLCLLHNLR